ncbi:MAG: A/G-specific adenine glycosylase [Hyphomicrobiaceae bacterium]
MPKHRRRTIAARAAAALLAWYDRERRDLPWRAPPGVRAEPYRVWLSEIMLQQTTVKAVVPYYDAFLKRWPTVEALAAAALDDVLAAWAGLGYYARARNLHVCAQTVALRHGGVFPATEDGLRALPGIGPYTAAAIAAIAFGRRTVPIDGNVERVLARLFAVTTPLPGAKADIRTLAAGLAPAARSGDFAQALMDLGATICTPRQPACALCPLTDGCAARARGIAAALPVKAAKSERPVRYGIAFLAVREDGHLLLRRRSERGLLAGMLEVPSTAWTPQVPAPHEVRGAAPLQADWHTVPGTVAHIFTHFRLELTVCRASVAADTASIDGSYCRWVPRGDLGAQALPSVMRKVIAHALPETGHTPGSNAGNRAAKADRADQ